MAIWGRFCDGVGVGRFKSQRDNANSVHSRSLNSESYVDMPSEYLLLDAPRITGDDCLFQ